MKYIDADRLRANIEALIAGTPSAWTGAPAAIEAYKDILNSIELLQEEQPKEICHKCIHHGKDDGYCYNPHGGIQSLINENGVYECTGFCEQDQPEVDLEKEIERFLESEESTSHTNAGGYDVAFKDTVKIARHFYELGLNTIKKENK